jgi:hypothetical protein
MFRECENCGQEFEAVRSTARFCSDRCRKQHRRAELAQQEPEPQVTPAPEPAPIDGFGEIDRLDRALWALRICEQAINAGKPNLPGLLREHSRLVQLISDLEREAEAEAEESQDADIDPDESAFDPDDFVTG